MGDVADHGIGNRERAPRTAREIDVVAHVGTGQGAHRRRRQRLQATPGTGQQLDVGVRRKRNPAAVGQHQSHREVAPAVPVRDDLLQRLGHRRVSRKTVTPRHAG
jgi:hypothetical protein